MTIELEKMAKRLNPKETTLFFGSGSSIPSDLPSAASLIDKLGQKFSLDTQGYSLTEISQFVEDEFSRKHLIGFLRTLYSNGKAKGGIRNLPLYDWASVYTTNYDTIVEQSYDIRKKPLTVIS